MTEVQWSWATGWDRGQNEAIENLQYEAMRTASRLHAAQRETRKQFEKQLSSVNTRLDIVMEWLDLRFAQLDFDEYAVRREARNQFRALAAHDVVAIRELTDVPGYWLPPMAAPLAKLVLSRQNDRVEPFADTDLPADIAASLATGRDRDPIRSDLFLVATSICFDLPRLRSAPLLRLLAEPMDLEFGEDPTVVARGWRTLWEQVADGDFGTAAIEVLTRRLTESFDPATADTAAWETAIQRHANGSATATLDVERALPVLAQALSELAEVDRAEGSGPTHREAWQTCLQELVSEPSEPERPLVAAMWDLRPSAGTEDGEPGWRGRAGTVAELLCADLLGAEVPTGRRALALRVAGPYLRQRITAVCEAELTAGPPSVVIRDSAVKIPVTAEGPDRAAYDKAVERRRRVEPVWVPPLPLIVAIVAALLAVAAVAAVFQSWVLAGFALLLTAPPVWWRLGARGSARDAAGFAESRLADLNSRVDTATAQASVKRDEQRRRQERIRDARQRLLAILPES